MQQKEMNKDQQKKMNSEFISKINKLSKKISEIRPSANYILVPKSNLIKFNIPLKPYYRVLKIKEWLEEEKWKKLKPEPQVMMPGEAVAYYGRGEIVGAYHSIDAEAELTRMLSEEIAKAIQDKRDKMSPKEIREEKARNEKIIEQIREFAKENGDTFKSKPNKR